jgi:cell division GTPase FtsZ
MEQGNVQDVKRRFSVGFVGIGQGGSSVAQTLAKRFDIPFQNVVALNLSDADLRAASLIPESNRILLDKNRFGAGKNRDLSKSYALEKKEFILDKLGEIFGRDKGINLIYVFYSLDGGTGSGIGPYMTALLESDMFEKSNGCLTFGVPILPDQNAGKVGLENTIKALKEISNLSKSKAGRFILIDNNTSSQIKDDAARWRDINDRVANTLKRYLFTSYTSASSNLDFEDRYVALRVPGCHSFCTFNPNESYPTPDSPFVLPEGARVDRMASEIPEGGSELRGKLASVIGCTIDEPNMVGYYAEDEVGAIPIVHFAGFSNLAKVTERYQGWFSEIKQRAEAAAKVDASKGAGFSSIEENDKWLESQNETRTNMSAEDLFNLLGD